jgi:hypothetical protein
MSVLTIDAHFAFGFKFQIRKDGGNQAASTGDLDGRPAEVIIAAERITGDEPQRRWWRVVLPFVSLVGATALRWLFRIHGIG